MSNLRRLKHDIDHFVVVIPPSILCRLFADLDRLSTSSRAGGVGQKLRLDTSIHGSKQKRCSIDRLCNCQVSMVLKNHSFGVPQGFGDMFSFVLFECYSAKAGIYAVIVVEPRLVYQLVLP